MHVLLQNVTPPVNNILWVALDVKALAKIKANFASSLVYYDSSVSFETNSTEFQSTGHIRYGLMQPCWNSYDTT
jgi:hypothetical protein